jgi:integrase
MSTTKERHINRGLRKRCGCPRTKWPKCEHAWQFNYQPRIGVHKGVPFRISLDKHVGRRISGKNEAESEARKLKVAIDEGRFGVALPVRDTLTVGQLLTAYMREYVTLERPRSLVNVRYQVGAIAAVVLELPTGEPRAFGAWHLCDVGAGALEKFRAARRTQTIVTAADQDGQQRARRKGGAGTTNRDLGLLRAMFNWAIRLDYVDTTPFKKSTETVVKLTKESVRRRRLEGDEGERLLKACDPLILNPKTKAPHVLQPRPRLRPIVEAAIETGCRRGELLSLQWWQVKDLASVNPRLDLPAWKTKTAKDRVVPISDRLKAILDMRRTDPSGAPHGPQAYVLGNEIGQRTRSIKTAWRLACRRAGIVDLRFHDLRREAGSRWLEGGVPLQVVRDWLGHANISQTSTYLQSTLAGQHDAMRRFEAARALRASYQLSTSAGVQPGATEGPTQGGSEVPNGSGATKNPQQTVN